ncbi:flagellar hook-length control protein FliK [Alteribacillus sp. HJP-4]|uniref:flagellar hook-length control protein FliK n=1 Tax=Alteribacillus sp. HJP-4 TaxID=2775394 RepID=UPI0035CCD9BB
MLPTFQLPVQANSSKPVTYEKTSRHSSQFLQLLGEAMPSQVNDIMGIQETDESLQKLVQQFFKEAEAFTEEFSDELTAMLEDWPGSMDLNMEKIFSMLPDEVQQMHMELLNEENRVDIQSNLLQALQSGKSENDTEDLDENENGDKVQQTAGAAAALFAVLGAHKQFTQQSHTRENAHTLSKSRNIEFLQALASLSSHFLPGLNRRSLSTESLLQRSESQLTETNQGRQLTLAQFSSLIKSNGNANKNSDYLQNLLNRTFAALDPAGGSLPSSLSQEGTQQPAKVQQLVMHLGENKTEYARQQEFTRQLQELLGKTNLPSLKNGAKELTLKLHPEHLGRVDIKLTQQNGQIIAQLLTTTKAARELVEQQIHHLKQSFQQQNIQVERIEIQQQISSYLHQEQEENQENKQQPPENAQQDHVSEDDNSFADILEELTFNEQV